MTDKSTGALIGRLAGEALAIFFGVTAALAGQAWFESQADRRAEREFLETVVEELELVDQVLSDADQFFRLRREVFSQLFSITSSSVAPNSADSLVATARGLAFYIPAAPLTSFDDVLAPERLTVVDDPDLRRTLSRFRSQVGFFRGSIEQNTGFVFSELRGFLHEHFGFCSDRLPPEELLVQLPCRTPGTVDPGVLPQLESFVHLLVLQYSNILATRATASGSLAELRTAITVRLAAL